MASRIILLLGIIAHTTCTTNSMAMKKILDSDTSIYRLEMSTALESMKISKEHDTRPVISPEKTQQEKKNIEEPAVIDKRSIQENWNKLIISKSEIGDDNGNKMADAHGDNRDDLETAAGTNILRPLFVYRQQVAYRERIRKASRRRAVPNF